MEKWFKHFQGYVVFSAIVVGVVLWAFSTFATLSEAQSVKKEVLEREASVRVYVDQRHEEVSRELHDIREALKKLDQRSYEMLMILRK